MQKKELIVIKNYHIYSMLETLKKKSKGKELIFLCIGNSKIWYDSFGPIVGGVLKLMDIKHYIYGNTKSNITSYNIKKYINMIYSFHNNPYVIVIDNVLSNNSLKLELKEGSLICASLSDNKVEVGDFSIKYSLNEKDMLNNENYYKMLLDIKLLCFYMKFIF